MHFPLANRKTLPKLALIAVLGALVVFVHWNSEFDILYSLSRYVYEHLLSKGDGRLQEMNDVEVQMHRQLDSAASSFRITLRSLGLENDQTTNTTERLNATLENMQIISGWSINHHKEGERLCQQILNNEELKANRNTTLIIYDLGGLNAQVRASYIEKCSIAVFRTFNTTKYPPYVSDLHQYRWKMLIIAETLLEFPVVLWTDSSLTFTKTNNSLQAVLDNANEQQQGAWLFGPTGHSIAAATNPKITKYIPMGDIMVRTMMFDASPMLAVRTRKTLQYVIRPAAQCALIADCINPPGSQMRCNFKKGDRFHYANCHRFDQSVINLVLSIRFRSNSSRYYFYDGPLKTSRM